jgi:hypothetical protein
MTKSDKLKAMSRGISRDMSHRPSPDASTYWWNWTGRRGLSGLPVVSESSRGKARDRSDGTALT